jgi:hypothetical protein
MKPKAGDGDDNAKNDSKGNGKQKQVMLRHRQIPPGSDSAGFSRFEAAR